ncbi:hypothetical protein D3C71_1479990 [compost metagenome]
MHQPLVQPAFFFRLWSLVLGRLFNRVQTQGIHQPTFAALLAVLGNALVVGDAVEPGLELRLTLEVFQPVQHFQHHFLTDIVGIPVVPQITRTDVEQGPLVAPHELFIGASNVVQLLMRTRHQLFVGELAGVITHGRRMNFIQNGSGRQSGQCRRATPWVDFRGGIH